jgi:hypothetical protein
VWAFSHGKLAYRWVAACGLSSTVAEGPVDPNWSQQNLRPSTGRDLIRDDSTGGWARRTPVAAWPDSSTEMAAALRELHQRQCGEDCRVNSVDQELLIVPDEVLEPGSSNRRAFP